MRSSPVSAWQELSALYEQADEFDGAALDAWLASPRIAAHAQLPALRRMLAARDKLRDSDFLNAPPRLEGEAPGIETQGLRAGAMVGPYRLLGPLGAGGMAEVWLAERSDGAFRRRVAIKLMFRQVGGAARDSIAQRFERERDILASLDHPNIAALHDAGVTPAGQPWLALEYVEGRPLADWCDHGRLGVVERMRLFRQVLLAVQHAHTKLVIHRDLKPANILVAGGGEVHLLDFGIAKLLEPGEGAQADTELTRAAGRPMTPLYASPEQLRGEPLTTACDIYALGVVLYELLCGARPYEVRAESAALVEQAILETDPRAPSRRALREEVAERRGLSAKALRKALAGDLDAIVLHALAKSPARRYASADAMLADIDRWLDGDPVRAHAPGALYRWGKFVRRNRLAVGLGTGAMMALAGVAAVAVIQGREAQREAARAVAARDFLIEMFRHADTAKVRGVNMTVRELLDRGRKDVSRQLASQPELQSDLLQAIASIEHEMGEYVHAERTFDEAAQMLEQRGDRRRAAVVRAEQAYAVLHIGDLPRGLALVEQARRLAAGGALDPAALGRIDWVEGWLHTLSGDPQRAHGLFERGLERATRSFGPDHMRAIEALQGLSVLAADRRDLRTALSIQDDIAARAGRNKRLEPRDRVQIMGTRVRMLFRVGAYRRAYDEAAVAVERCRTTVGPHEEMCGLILSWRMHAAMRLGWAQRMRADLPVVHAIAADALSPRRQAEAQGLACRMQAALGERCAGTELERRLLEVGATATLSADQRLNALLALAESALRTGQPERAREFVQRGLAAPSAGNASAASRAWADVLLGIALLAQARPAEALEVLQRGVQGHAALLGEEHPLTLVFAIDQALALSMLGREREAAAIVERAEPVLREALGEDAPTYEDLRKLQRRWSQGEGVRGDTPSSASVSPLFI